MPPLTAPSTTLDLLRAGLDLAERIGPPDDVSVVVAHQTYTGDIPDDVMVRFHPRSYEAKRAVMVSPGFAGATWGRLGDACSTTTVDGIVVWVHDATRRAVAA